MKVFLIIPKKNSYTILPAPDIGLAYVARAALNAGAEVEILDAHKENVNPSEIKKYLKDKSYDIVGLKCLSADRASVLEYCKYIKDYDQRIITLLGGYHPTALPMDLMKYKEVDYIIRGEGEPGIFSLIKNVMEYGNNIPAEKLGEIPSLAYRDKNCRGVIKQNPLILEENLDGLGFPAWHLFKIKEYPELPGSGGMFLPIITSRGCPSSCTFCCASSIHGKRIRTRSPRHVISEINWLINNFNIQKVSIYDDNFMFSKKHAIDFCEQYMGSNFRVNFDIPQGVRMDRIDKDILLKLEQTGCDYMGVGIESGEDKTLRIIKKGINTTELEEKIDLIKKHTNIKLMGFFIIGFPHETEEGVLKTLDFSFKLKLDYAAFTIFTPFPGTELFDQMLKEGYFSLETIKWEDLLLDRETFRHREISHKGLKKLQRKGYIRFYFRPSKIKFFFRIIIKERSFLSYLRRFISILKN